MSDDLNDAPYTKMFDTVEERCDNCINLIPKNDLWFCSEANYYCHEVIRCREYDKGGAICKEYSEVEIPC